MNSYSTVRVPNLFPVDSRPIYVTPTANMTAKNKDVAYPQMAQTIRGMLLHHPDDRVLVHSVSYELTKYLSENITKDRPIFFYLNAGQRDKAIANYRLKPKSVLIAPSLERGVDFKDDDCRVVAIAKVPFPNLGDKQISARLHTPGGQLWYAVQTVRTLVQMTGRGVRHDKDHAVSYIFDQQFVSNVWRKSQHLLPQWWRDALDMSATYVRTFKQKGEI